MKPRDKARGRPAPRCRVVVNVETKRAEPRLASWLARHATRIAALAKLPPGLITVSVVGDAQMGALHKAYTGVAGTTDVLTFDLREGTVTRRTPTEADVAVCLDEAERQAKRRGHEPRLELLLYVVHAMMHLLGYDDHDPEQFTRMHRREDELLTAAGFGAVYHAEEEARAATVKGKKKPRPRGRGQ